MDANKNVKSTITVETTVNIPVEKAWEYWTQPEHITKWNFASPDWCCPRATNDIKTGGKFSARMESVDGSMGFDFEGVYDNVIPHKLIEYSLGDERKVRITFQNNGSSTTVTETFDPENLNPMDMQKAGWQAIIDNYKKHAESVK
ncbi:MAG: SRPBCC family protein [Bacteroidota bacterium]|nr:SRPBCC family protein [Bacteroidota bacterium]